MNEGGKGLRVWGRERQGRAGKKGDGRERGKVEERRDKRWEEREWER